jgi:hypothetical protein
LPQHETIKFSLNSVQAQSKRASGKSSIFAICIVPFGWRFRISYLPFPTIPKFYAEHTAILWGSKGENLRAVPH